MNPDSYTLKPPLPDPLKTPPFFSQWAKLLRKRERNRKDPSRASTKEMTVKLDFFWLFDCYGKTFLDFQT